MWLKYEQVSKRDTWNEAPNLTTVDLATLHSN